MSKLDSAGKISEHIQLDWNKLMVYLNAQLNLDINDYEIQQFHGGHANLSFLIKTNEQEFVLRRPPEGKIARGAHDMKREFRVLSGLHPYYSKAPKAFLYCGDESILDAEFILMERRQGVVIRYQLPEVFENITDVENSLSKALVTAQFELHSLDPDALGLSDFGKPDGFLQRQLKGWEHRASALLGGDRTIYNEVSLKLNSFIPQTQRISIIHNDFKFDNCQFDPEDPTEVASVFDWDMATLGDPLFDFASSLAYWPDEFFISRNLPALMKGEFPSKDELKRWYFDLSGLDDSHFVWYECIAYWKTSIIAQQLLDRYLASKSFDAKMEKFRIFAPAFALKAKELSGHI